MEYTERESGQLVLAGCSHRPGRYQFAGLDGAETTAELVGAPDAMAAAPPLGC